jgi:hypothetical protein
VTLSPRISPALSGELSACMVASASAAPILTPLELLGDRLVLDLDSDYVTLGTGARVATWPDQSSKGNHVTQGTLGNQPTQVLGDLDGHAAVSFDGALSQRLVRELGTFAGPLAGSTPHVYAVLFYNNTATTYLFESCDTELGANRGFTFLINVLTSTASVFWRIGTELFGTTSTPAGVVADWTDPKLIYTYADTVDLRARCFVSGVELTPGLVASSGVAGLRHTQTKLSVGMRANPTLGFSGKMYRWLIVDSPTSDEHASIMAYLLSHYPSLPHA